MPNIGPMELVVVMIIALIVIGPKKLPEVGKSLGNGMREFKNSISGASDSEKDEQAVGTSRASDQHLLNETKEKEKEPVAV